jgi:hypothetical protein
MAPAISGCRAGASPITSVPAHAASAYLRSRYDLRPALPTCPPQLPNNLLPQTQCERFHRVGRRARRLAPLGLVPWDDTMYSTEKMTEMAACFFSRAYTECSTRPLRVPQQCWCEDAAGSAQRSIRTNQEGAGTAHSLGVVVRLAAVAADVDTDVRTRCGHNRRTKKQTQSIVSCQQDPDAEGAWAAQNEPPFAHQLEQKCGRS